MKDMTPFQLVLTGIFAAFILIGVAFFALFRGGGVGGPVANITVWGLFPESQFAQLLEISGINDDKTLNITYTQANASTYDQDFIEMLARGQVPDLIMLPHTSLLRHRDKISAIPYDVYAERTFRDTFIQEGELFLSQDGVLALPVTIDPLVMYWNRTMFSNAGLATPPRYWDEFFNLTQLMVQRDGGFNITKSALAFGEYQNVTNSKAVLSALIMQAGSTITTRNQNTVRSTLAESFNQPIRPADAAVNFYTEFSNPVKSFYSWNRSLPESRDFFTSGDLAVYFGFASELDTINSRNPNLNFDVAVIPQSRGGAEIITYGNMLGLAIPNASRNQNAALRAATILSNRTTIAELSLMSRLPPVRRDLLVDRPSDPFMAVFYDSALWSRAWLDPDRNATGEIFRTMVEDITSGRKRASQAVQDASTALQGLLSNMSI